jgi:VanZ family protein
MNEQVNQSKRRRHVLTVALSAYWLAMFIGTHVPSPSIEPAVPNQDKVLHVLAYAGLAFLLSGVRSGAGRLSRRWAVEVFVIVAIYGVLDELTQNFVPGRFADVLDWIGDAAGAMLGIGLFAVCSSVIHRFARACGE